MSLEMKRLAVFVPNMAGGGAERAALKLAEGLAARGFETDLVLSSATGPRMADIPSSVRVVDLGATRVLTSLLPLVRYLRSAKPHAMASVMVQTSIVAVWAKRIAGYPKRLAVVEQNNLSSVTSHGKSIRDRMMPALARRFFPWAECVVGVSAGVVDDLRQLLPNIPADRFRVIFNPIVTPDITEQANASSAHPWLEQSIPVFVAAGRLHPQKDFPTLIQAFAQVRSARQARLIILGEGPNRAGLEALIQSLGLSDDVGLPGHTDNPYAHFARASAFVLSSRWEGLPTVLIEALSCGAPVIATDCPSGPREILAHGRYGPLVPVGDVAALASAMNAALDGELSAPPEESWRPYMMDAVVDDYLEVFDVDG